MFKRCKRLMPHCVANGEDSGFPSPRGPATHPNPEHGGLINLGVFRVVKVAIYVHERTVLFYVTVCYQKMAGLAPFKEAFPGITCRSIRVIRQAPKLLSCATPAFDVSRVFAVGDTRQTQRSFVPAFGVGFFYNLRKTAGLWSGFVSKNKIHTFLLLIMTVRTFCGVQGFPSRWRASPLFKSFAI